MSTAKEIAQNIEGRGVNTPRYYYQILNSVINLIANKLYDLESDIISGDLAVTLIADAEYGTLPADFWGLISEPYENGKTYTLKPSPGKDTELLYTSSGSVTYYKIKNDKIYVYPPTSAEIIINGDYFVKPTAVTTGTDTIPYFEQFDNAIIEGVILTIQGTVMAEVERSLDLTISKIINRRGKKQPKQMPDGMHWDFS